MHVPHYHPQPFVAQPLRHRAEADASHHEPGRVVVPEIVPGAVHDIRVVERRVKSGLHVQDWLARVPCVARMHEDVGAVEFGVALRVQSLQGRVCRVVEWDGMRLVVLRPRHAQDADQPVLPGPLRAEKIGAPEVSVSAPISLTAVKSWGITAEEIQTPQPIVRKPDARESALFNALNASLVRHYLNWRIAMQPRKCVGYGIGLIALLMATNWVVVQAQGAAGAQGVERGRGERGERQLVYEPTSGTGGGRIQNGSGIMVFDVRNKFRLIKRIPFPWDYPAWADPDGDEVKGMEVSAETGMLYLATFTGLHAFSLITEKMVWERTYDRTCCDRLSLSPDSKILYVPELGPAREKGTDGWLVVDAITGKTIKKIDTPRSRGAHNTIYSLDGSKVFMAGLNGAYVSVADTKTHTVAQTIGPFSAPPANMGYPANAPTSIRPFTTNGSGTLVFVNLNGLLGFEIGDVRTGKMLHRVEVPGYPWHRSRVMTEGTGSHGIAMSPDEKEIWLTDCVHGVLHVFDSTVMPPKWMMEVRLPRRARPERGERVGLDYPDWVTFGLDGKYVYSSTGDVIDAATKQVVASLIDEFGAPFRSQKMVEVLFRDGKPVRASDQFGTGQVRGPGTN